MEIAKACLDQKKKGLEKDIMKENGEINRKNNLDKEEIWVQNEESEPDNFIIMQSRKKKEKKGPI